MDKELVLTALNHAYKRHKPPVGLLLHSDRGSQYCSKVYQDKLLKYKMICSMSRKGECYDNAPMESFWGLLKNELIYRCHFRTRQDAIKAIREYIEIFYNRQRKQANLGFLSPAKFTQQFYQAQRWAA
jgi:putative transposase